MHSASTRRVVVVFVLVIEKTPPSDDCFFLYGMSPILDRPPHIQIFYNFTPHFVNGNAQRSTDGYGEKQGGFLCKRTVIFTHYSILKEKAILACLVKGFSAEAEGLVCSLAARCACLGYVICL
jgi:hypothetical protein